MLVVEIYEMFVVLSALTDSDGLVSMVTRRMKSSRAVVRRSALVVLESIIIYNDCMEMSKVGNVK